FEAARETLVRSLKGNPNNAATNTNLAVVELSLGNKAAAIDLCQRALELDPEFDQARRLLSYIASQEEN
ncbi:MAG: hypothetical protein COA73_09115, partial [Candidatus Hydrogenedentota bacterium]